jgi:hypothetical protein
MPLALAVRFWTPDGCRRKVVAARLPSSAVHRIEHRGAVGIPVDGRTQLKWTALEREQGPPGRVPVPDHIRRCNCRGHAGEHERRSGQAFPSRADVLEQRQLLRRQCSMMSCRPVCLEEREQRRQRQKRVQREHQVHVASRPRRRPTRRGGSAGAVIVLLSVPSVMVILPWGPPSSRAASRKIACEMTRNPRAARADQPSAGCWNVTREPSSRPPSAAAATAVTTTCPKERTISSMY